MYTTQFDDLPNELVAYVSTFLDPDDHASFRSVNRACQTILNEALDLVGHSPNSTTYNMTSFQENGPTFMKYLRNISLYSSVGYLDADYEVEFPKFLRKGLLSLQLDRVRRPLNLDIQAFDYIDDTVRETFENRTWTHFRVLEHDYRKREPFRIKCKHATIGHPKTYVKHDIRPSESLTLQDLSYANEASAIEKFFQHPTTVHTLTIHGQFTSQILCAIQASGRVQLSVTTLVLQSQLPELWPNITVLQRLLPNLEALTMSSSNIIAKDFQFFDWSLWPNLRSLNLENNWTLECVDLDVPKQITSLYLQNTLHSYPSISKLMSERQCEAMSMELDVNIEWASLFARHGKSLKALHFHKRNHIETLLWEPFWTTLKHLHTITIFIYTRTKSLDRQLAVVRSWVPNTFVKLIFVESIMYL